MSLIEMIFPRFCLGCSLPGRYICPSCQKKFFVPKSYFCFHCKKSSLYGLTHNLCLKKFNIDGVVYLFYYNNFFKKIIKNFKYRLAKEIWNELKNSFSEEIINKLAFYKKLSGKVFFQPIPLSNKKLKERGFNQAYLIAQFFQNYLNYPIADFLIRKKDKKPQAEIKTKKQRYLNLKGAFEINKKELEKIKDKNDLKLILVDDLITTGSTLKEAARVLKKSGFKKVYALTLAKG